MSWDKIKHKTYEGQRGNSKQWESAFNIVMSKETQQPQEFPSLYACTDLDTLKKEFKRLAKLYHPDKMGDTKEANELTKKLLDSYSKLKSLLK